MPPKQNYDDNFYTLAGQINALASTIDGLNQVQSDLAALSSTVSSLSGDLSSIQNEITSLQEQAEAAKSQEDGEAAENLSRIEEEVEALTNIVNEAVLDAGALQEASSAAENLSRIEEEVEAQAPKNAPIRIKRNTEEKSDKQILAEILGVVAKNKIKSIASKLLCKPTSNSSR
jgi:signal transduction histidine kinase